MFNCEVLVFYHPYARVYVQRSNHTPHTMPGTSRHMIAETSCYAVDENPVDREPAMYPHMRTQLPLALLGYATSVILLSARLPAVDRGAMSHDGG
jgi:hypothetical protein